MQFPLKLDARFLRRSYAKRMFRGLWKLAAAYLCILVFVCSSYSDPELRGWCIFFLAVVGMGTSIFIFAWFRQSTSIAEWVAKQGSAPITYVLSEETVETASQIGSTKLRWDSFSELLITDFDILLLLPRADGALTLDTLQVPHDALDYLKDRFRAHGKKVVDKRKRASIG